MKAKFHVRSEAAPQEIPRAAMGNAPLAEPNAGMAGRAHTIARALEHKKVCVVLDRNSFEGSFMGRHVVRDYNQRHAFDIRPGARVDDLLLDSCMTLTNMEVFLRMLAPGHTRTEDHHTHSGKVTVPVALKKDLIAFDSYEALPEQQFDALMHLLADFRAGNPTTVIVASYARRPVFTTGEAPELDEAATDALEQAAVLQLDALFDAGLIDHLEAPRNGNFVHQLDLMCLGALLVEGKHRLLDAQIAAHAMEAHASPDDPQERVMVEPPAE